MNYLLEGGKEREWIAMQDMFSCCGYDGMNRTAVVCDNKMDCKAMLEEDLSGISVMSLIVTIVLFVFFVFLTVTSCQRMVSDAHFHYCCLFCTRSTKALISLW